MATTQCPSCGLTVPYFCCEGLVCPACGYDEERAVKRAQDTPAGATSAGSLPESLLSNPPSVRPPVQSRGIN
jgi:uncharacterized Zn finger protein (UPF0148 family)